MTAVSTSTFRSAAIAGLAVVVPDGRVAQRGFGSDAAGIEQVLRAARQLLRETTPAVEVVDFRFAEGRAVVGSLGDAVVLVQTRSIADARFVLRDCALDADAISEELGALGSGRHSLAASVAPVEVLRSHVAQALNAVLREARKHLGGPVIRNYLKKSRGDAKELANLSIGLDGQVADPAPEQRATEELGQSAGEWLEAFFVQASVVAPELRDIDVVAITAEQEAFVRPLRFYAARAMRTR